MGHKVVHGGRAQPQLKGARHHRMLVFIGVAQWGAAKLSAGGAKKKVKVHGPNMMVQQSDHRHCHANHEHGLVLLSDGRRHPQCHQCPGVLPGPSNG